MVSQQDTIPVAAVGEDVVPVYPPVGRATVVCPVGGAGGWLEGIQLVVEAAGEVAYELGQVSGRRPVLPIAPPIIVYLCLDNLNDLLLISIMY